MLGISRVSNSFGKLSEKEERNFSSVVVVLSFQDVDGFREEIL
jgi:hypothetical protein